MGFIKNQQVNLAMRLLAWQYQRQGQPLPTGLALKAQAGRLVDDAHRIARERGGNVLSIIKELVEDVRRR
jgi:hypothetical protein